VISPKWSERATSALSNQRLKLTGGAIPGFPSFKVFAGGPGSLALAVGGGPGGWQMTRLSRWIGGGFLLLGFAVLTAMVIHPFALGGVVWGGKVEDGRYFVVSKGDRYTEVSETQWRIEQYLECGYGWLPVMMVWIGLTLRDAPDMPKEPAPLSSTTSPIWPVLGTVVGTAALAAGGCYITGVPWTVVFGTWLALWGCFLLALLHSRPTRTQSRVEQGAADVTMNVKPRLRDDGR